MSNVGMKLLKAHANTDSFIACGIYGEVRKLRAPKNARHPRNASERRRNEETLRNRGHTTVHERTRVVMWRDRRRYRNCRSRRALESRFVKSL